MSDLDTMRICQSAGFPYGTWDTAMPAQAILKPLDLSFDTGPYMYTYSGHVLFLAWKAVHVLCLKRSCE